jgi:hypothetical protein
MKKKGLIFVDFDMLIRHFIDSGIFTALEEEFDLTYVFQNDEDNDKKGIHHDLTLINVKNKILFNVPRKRMGYWYHLFATSILHNQRGTPNYSARLERISATNGKLLVFIYVILSLPILYNIFRFFILKNAGIYKPLEDLINNINPDVVIHPSILTGFFIQELPPICNKLNIPLIVLMNSWDNPSGKAVVTGHPDKLVVWGKQTKKHAVEYMKIPEDRVEIFGAAQFQIYREKESTNYNKLCEIFNVPNDCPILLYAGVSKSVNETRHLKIIDNAILKGDVAKCHVIYRPHPWRGKLVEGETSFYEMNYKHITMDPTMEDYYLRIIDKGVDGFYLADYNNTKKLLDLVSATIAPISTILLETIILGKPVLMFFPKEDMKEKFGDFNKITYKLAHFREFWECEGILQCMNINSLADNINSLLKYSMNKAVKKNLKEHSNFFVDMQGAKYSERLVALSMSLVHKQ